MIGTLLMGAAKVALGCVRLGFKGFKSAISISKILGRNLSKAFKKGKKLGSGVAKVISKSRALAKQATFDKEAALKRGRERQDEIDEFTAPTVIVKSRRLGDTESTSPVKGTRVLKKSHVFTKEEK